MEGAKSQSLATESEVLVRKQPQARGGHRELRTGRLTGTLGKWYWSEDPLRRTICEEMAGTKVLLSLGLRLQASALVWCSWNDTQPISWRQDSRGGGVVGGGDSLYCV